LHVFGISVISLFMSTKNLPKQLDTQLNRHFLACSAFVGTAVMMTCSKTDAGVVYSGLRNINVPTTNIFGGIYLDLTKPDLALIPTTSGSGPADGLNTVLPGWDVNFYKGTSALRWWYNSGVTAVFNAAHHVAALGAGVTVDGSSLLGTYQTMTPEFAATTAFMGIQFPDDSNTEVFGWIRITGGATTGIPATIVDWAYEDSGAGILTGAGIVPEPSSLALGCLAAGAAGLAAWRKRGAA
jgi:subtilisin family serine protease